MKKFYYVLGALVVAAAIFAFIAIMLKKLKVSLSVEGIDDDLLGDGEDEGNQDIQLTIDNDTDYLRELNSLIDDDPQIEVETL